MMNSLYSGVTGLQMHQLKMGVIGNNIANVNTVGFKVGRITFQELLSHTLRQADLPRAGRGGINPMQLGLGVGVGSIDVNHTAGSLQATGMGTDLAILGNGFFIVNDGDDRYYTRVGTLGLDRDGTFVNNSNGFRVQGWNADWEGNINTNATISDLRVRVDDLIPSRASTLINYVGNLNGAAPQGSSVTEEMIVFDSLGKKHNVSMSFEKKVFVEGTENNIKGWIKQYEGIDNAVLNFNNPRVPSAPLSVDYVVRGGVVTFDVTLATDANEEIISTVQEVVDAIDNLNVEVVKAETRINTVNQSINTISSLDLDVANTTGGTFTISIDGMETGALAFDSSAAAIQSALEALPGLLPGDVTVAGPAPVPGVSPGGPFTITVLNRDVEIDYDGSDLIGAVDDEITLIQAGQNAVERLTLSEAKGGFFTLNFFGQITDPIDFDASAEEIQAALESLSRVGAGNVLVTGDDGGPYTIEFTGNLEHGLLTVPRTVTSHSAEYRVDLDTPTGGTFNLNVNGEITAPIAFNATSIDIYEALVALDGIEENDVEVSGMGTATNPFVFTFKGELSHQAVGMVFDGSLLTAAPNAGILSNIYTIDLGGANLPGDTFTLTVDGQTTLAIAFDATNDQIRGAIEALPGIAVGDVAVIGDEGGPFTIQFKGNKNLVYNPTGLVSAINPALLAGNETPILEGTVVRGNELVGLEVLDGTQIVSRASTTLREIVNRWLVFADGPEGLRMFDNDGERTDHWVVRFDENGRYLRDNIGNFDFRPEGAARVTITPDFNRMTQYAADFNVFARDTDGYETGSLDSFTIDKTGIVIGIYSNGLSRELGQIALAHFSNPEGLRKEGETLFANTSNSGLPQIGEAGIGGRGIISPGDLEMSNVDLAEQFTEMMTTQRGFQANSRTITTTDQILQELVNLIR